MAKVAYGPIVITCDAQDVARVKSDIAARMATWRGISRAFSWDDSWFVIHALQKHRQFTSEEYWERERYWDSDNQREMRWHLRRVVSDIQKACSRFGLPAYAVVSMTVQRGRLLYCAGLRLDVFCDSMDYLDSIAQ